MPWDPAGRPPQKGEGPGEKRQKLKDPLCSARERAGWGLRTRAALPAQPSPTRLRARPALLSLGWAGLGPPFTLHSSRPARSSVQCLLRPQERGVSSLSELGFIPPWDGKRSPFPGCCWAEERSPSGKVLGPAHPQGPRGLGGEGSAPGCREQRDLGSKPPASLRPRSPQGRGGARPVSGQRRPFLWLPSAHSAHVLPSPLPLQSCVPPALTLPPGTEAISESAPHSPGTHLGSVCPVLGVRHTCCQMHD